MVSAVYHILCHVEIWNKVNMFLEVLPLIEVLLFFKGLTHG